MTMIKSTIIGGAAASEESGRATEREVSASFFLIISILPLASYHPPYFPLFFRFPIIRGFVERDTKRVIRYALLASPRIFHLSQFVSSSRKLESVSSSNRFSLFRCRTTRRCRGLRRSATLMESVASDEETRPGEETRELSLSERLNGKRQKRKKWKKEKNPEQEDEKVEAGTG